MNFKQIVNRYYDSILDFSGLITVSIFFLSIVGSYRFLLVLGIYQLLKALKLEKPVLFVFLPAYVVTFYLDLTNGPMFQPESKSHFLIALAVFILVDPLISKQFKKLVINLTEGKHFVECPSCHFNNIHLVETCTNCSYKKGNPTASFGSKVSPDQKGDKIPPSLLNLLTLAENEEILLHKKLTSFYQQLKNGNRVARKHFVITTANVIILDYFSFHIHMPNSWRERDIIPISEIVTIEGQMKKFTTMRPFLIIRTTNNDVYEIVFSTFGEYINDINQIAAIIKEINPQIEVNLNLSVPSWKKDFSISSTSRALLLLIFLILIVFYAFWQSFIVNGIK